MAAPAPLSPLAPKDYPHLPAVEGVRFATAAAGIRLAEEPKIKKPEEWWLLGQSIQRLALAFAKSGLAFNLENHFDRNAGPLLDVLIGIDKRFAKTLRQLSADGGLASAHHADQKDVGGGFHPGILDQARQRTTLARAHLTLAEPALHHARGDEHKQFGLVVTAGIVAEQVAHHRQITGVSRLRQIGEPCGQFGGCASCHESSFRRRAFYIHTRARPPAPH